MGDPGWYKRLPPSAREAVDQTGHAILGALGGLFCLDRPLVWWREFVSQRPIERIDDTARDMWWFAVGGTIGQAALVAVLVGVLR